MPRERVIVVGEAKHEGHALGGPRCEEREEFIPPEPVALDDLMNIQYTSGTTGFPKGCMLTQRYWLV